MRISLRKWQFNNFSMQKRPESENVAIFLYQKESEAFGYSNFCCNPWKRCFACHHHMNFQLKKLTIRKQRNVLCVPSSWWSTRNNTSAGAESPLPLRSNTSDDSSLALLQHLDPELQAWTAWIQEPRRIERRAFVPTREHTSEHRRSWKYFI